MRHSTLCSLCALLLLGSLGCLVMDAHSDRDDDDPTPRVDEQPAPTNNMPGPQPDPEPEPEPDPRPDPRPDPGATFVLEGKVSGQEATPAGTQIVALWSVTDTSPIYFYALGQGLASRDIFRLRLPSGDLPAEAMNRGGLGVAMLLALPEEAALPAQGQLTSEEFRALTARTLGISKRHAIVFRQEGGQPSSAWASSFTSGYQCAQGQAASSGQAFESFRPVPCDQVTIVLDGQRQWVNWR